MTYDANMTGPNRKDLRVDHFDGVTIYRKSQQASKTNKPKQTSSKLKYSRYYEAESNMRNDNNQGHRQQKRRAKPRTRLIDLSIYLNDVIILVDLVVDTVQHDQPVLFQSSLLTRTPELYRRCTVCLCPLCQRFDLGDVVVGCSPLSRWRRSRWRRRSRMERWLRQRRR